MTPLNDQHGAMTITVLDAIMIGRGDIAQSVLGQLMADPTCSHAAVLHLLAARVANLRALCSAPERPGVLVPPVEIVDLQESRAAGLVADLLNTLAAERFADASEIVGKQTDAWVVRMALQMLCSLVDRLVLERALAAAQHANPAPAQRLILPGLN